MPSTLAVVIGLACLAGAWAFARWRSPRPDFPPLPTSPDDPLMKDALAKAKASLDEFLTRLRSPKRSALVKLRFVSSSEQVEHLWAEVLELLPDNELGVRLVTPPVSHSGPLDRLHRCPLDDIEDWTVRDPSGKVFGGFTQRAMFAIARRDGIRLPTELLRIEREYADA